MSGSGRHKIRTLIAMGWRPGYALGPMAAKGTRRQRRQLRVPNFNITEEINEPAQITA
jgi:hypothetical protein